MSIDLSGVQAFVEDELMDDECIITRDPEGTTDDTWDAESGTYTRPEGDDGIVYEGKCWVSIAGNQPATENEGGFDVGQVVYYVNIPLESNEVKDGDRIRITASLRNPNLVDKDFRAVVPQLGTFKVKQKVRMVQQVPKAVR